MRYVLEVMVVVWEVINKEYIEERERHRHMSLYFLFFGENKKKYYP